MSSSTCPAAQAVADVRDLQIVDVRGPAEFAGGALPAAMNLPLPRLRELMTQLDRSKPVLVNCAAGYRSIAAASLLRANGYSDVSDLLGGWNGWQADQDAATVG